MVKYSELNDNQKLDFIKEKEKNSKLNNENERSQIPIELRFKSEKACIQYYINRDLELLESDHTPLIVGRKFANCLKEERISYMSLKKSR